MAYVTTTPATGTAFIDRARSLFAGIATRIKRGHLYRKTFHGLDALTNRELADLGLCRSELHHVAREAARKATA